MKVTRSQVGDALLAVALAVIGVLGTYGAGNFAEDPARSVDLPAIMLVLATCATVVVRRRWPLATLAVAGVLLATYLALNYPYGPIFFPFVVTAYTAARHRPPARSALVAGAVLVLLPIHLLADASLNGFLAVGWAAGWVAVPYAIGSVIRLNREAVERRRAEMIREHVYDERLRVAQEVHDVVGHGLAAIKMQADVALHVLAKKPEQAEAALRAISRTSTEALSELRSTLAVVRRADAATREPTAGLERVPALAERMREAGLVVGVEQCGTARELPAAANLAAYRVVQESLTNVLRHGESNVANVEIGYETDAVVITISNPPASGSVDDPRPPRTGRGNGLGIAGMRQRVTTLGGEFSAGPMEGGGFVVHATIPTGGQA